MKMFFLLFTGFCLVFSMHVDAAVCPTEISPCFCLERAETNTSSLFCVSPNANNISRVIDVLETFLTTPDISPLESLQFQNGAYRFGMTSIPKQIRHFTKLNRFDVKRNKITFIESGAFNFTATLLELDLSDNLITAIAPGAFQGFILLILILFLNH